MISGAFTIYRTGESFLKQPFFRFITSGFSENDGCCEICAKTCHLGHDLIYRGEVDSFCDCGYANPNCKCVKKT